MSIVYGQCCRDCAEDAPSIGDGGYIGAPSLSPEPQMVEQFNEMMPSFGWITEPLRAVGLRTYEIERFAEWLSSHKGHRISLFEGDGPPELVARDETLGRSGWTRMVFLRSKAEESAKREALDTGVFEEAFYAVSCSDCRADLAAPVAEVLRPISELTIGVAMIDLLIERWRPIVERRTQPSTHRLMELIDPDQTSFMADLLSFLAAHRGHAVAAGLRS